MDLKRKESASPRLNDVGEESDSHSTSNAISTQPPSIVATGSPLLPYLSSVVFPTQPPTNIRKSNFFQFSVSVYDPSGQVVVFKECTYLGYSTELTPSRPIYNGTYYKGLVDPQTPGSQELAEIIFYLRVVDADTNLPIAYEGFDKNPELRRVLLAHQTTCNRCTNGISCGNSKDTPSSPKVEDEGKVLRFFVKCNQNCVLGAGAPKGKLRRFKMEVAIPGGTLGYSERMFVHNSSKYGKMANPCKRVKTAVEIQRFEPTLITICPTSGPTGTEMMLLGERLFPNVAVLFGDGDSQVRVPAKYINDTAITVTVPELLGRQTLGPIRVAAVGHYEGRPVYFESPVPFNLHLTTTPAIEHQITRIAGLLPPGPCYSDANAVLERAADFIEDLQKEHLRQQQMMFQPPPMEMATTPNIITEENGHSITQLEPGPGISSPYIKSYSRISSVRYQPYSRPSSPFATPVCSFSQYFSQMKEMTASQSMINESAQDWSSYSMPLTPVSDVEASLKAE